MNIPKEDGYYWYKEDNDDWRDKDESKLTIVKVENAKHYHHEWSLDCSKVEFMGTDITYQLHEMIGEFISKITTPDIK